MNTVTLRFPILVQRIKNDFGNYFQIRPLLFPFPIIKHQRHETCLTHFKKEIKQSFGKFTINKETETQLLWYLFYPDSLIYDKVFSDFNLQKEAYNGDFGAAVFRYKGLRFVYLPSFNFMFISFSENDEAALHQEVRDVAIQLLREHREDLGESFNVDYYFSSKKEFVTEMVLDVKVRKTTFKFDTSKQDNFFSRLFGDTEFDGLTELEKVGHTLNDDHPSGLQRAFFREKEIEELYQNIFNEKNIPIAIIGYEGVGKHTLLHEVMRRYLDECDAKEVHFPQNMWHIDPIRVISGMSIVGMWQKRFEAILHYIKKPMDGKNSDKLLIDNVVALVRIGKSAQNNMTLSDVLKPFLEKKWIQVILVASPEEWKIMQEKHKRFCDLFQVMRIQPPDNKIAAQMVLRQRKHLEQESDGRISIQAVQKLFDIHRKFFRHRMLPGNVVKLMEQLMTKYRGKVVDNQEVLQEFEDFSGLSQKLVDDVIEWNHDEVVKTISTELVGQPEAVEAIVNTLEILRAKLNDTSKPIASFLFIGPTGVGKTQAAKVLSQFVNGTESKLIRFDMNEYIDAYAVQRLIGDYYNPEGQLTGKVRYQPFSVILLDEIEKAHSKVYDLLLQVLDDGRLTDSIGRTVDFSNTIIIMTSNIGSRDIGTQIRIGNNPTSADDVIYRKAVENHFRPEFINRIDRTLIFQPLSFHHILDIARLQIRELLKRDGFVRRTTIVNVSKHALEWVAKRGYNAQMGGRALKRQIEKDITTLSAEQLIQTDAEQPIILNITLDENRLSPKITPLYYAEYEGTDYLPKTPDETNVKRSFYLLLDDINNMLDDLADAQDRLDDYEEQLLEYGDQENIQKIRWQYFDFKDRLLNVQQDIKNSILKIRDRHLTEAPVLPLRLKRSVVDGDSWTDKSTRQKTKDYWFQAEAFRELSDGYRQNTYFFSQADAIFLDSHVQIEFMKCFAKGLYEGKIETLTLSFKCLVEGLGEAQIHYLNNLYANLFKDLDIHHKIAKDKTSITLDGYGLQHWLGGEMGIHLFYVSQQNPVPILVALDTLETPVIYPVIRLYDSITMTDLRTGFSNALNISLRELKLLIFAGMKA